MSSSHSILPGLRPDLFLVFLPDSLPVHGSIFRQGFPVEQVGQHAFQHDRCNIFKQYRRLTERCIRYIGFSWEAWSLSVLRRRYQNRKGAVIVSYLSHSRCLLNSTPTAVQQEFVGCEVGPYDGGYLAEDG